VRNLCVTYGQFGILFAQKKKKKGFIYGRTAASCAVPRIKENASGACLR
jgi:hypothetical protein